MCLLKPNKQYKTPIFRVNREFRLVHVYAADINRVEQGIQPLTTNYTVDPTAVSRLKCITFKDGAPFDAVIIALTMEVGTFVYEKNLST